MTINQLSVFVENKPGKIAGITRLLADAGVDLRALSIGDTRDFGILRIIVNDNEKAMSTLKAAGHVVSLNRLVAVRVEDKPGALASLLRLLADNSIDLEYMYAFFTHDRDHSYMALRVADAERTLAVLEQGGYPTLSPQDLDVG